jgi:hypothetical protein
MTAPHHATGVHTVIGVDAGSANLKEADHLIHRLMDQLALPPGTLACSHLVRTAPRHRTAISLALPDPATADAIWDRLVVLLAGPDQPTTAAALSDRAYGPPEAAFSAAQAASEHSRKQGGRAVVYPGVQHMTGTVTVAEVLTGTAIDRITVLGTPPDDPRGPDGSVRVTTRDHVRPEWRDEQLVLTLTPAPRGMLAPFEVPNPTPCCADHS